MSKSPYSVAAADYAASGWSPIPLPPAQKWPPPDGVTGAGGRIIGLSQAEDWSTPRARFNAGKTNFPVGNIALRLPKDIIGIDVDTYDGKAGESSLARAEAMWGELPATWRSSSRRDGSGILLFRVPEGLSWPESLRKFTGGGVEIIRWDHRYAIVLPSIHPEGRTYAWQTPDGAWVEDEIPDVADIPDLPEAWVAGLTEGKSWTERTAADISQGDVREWLLERDDGDPENPPCDTMRKTLARAGRQIMEAGDDGGAHDEARDGAWALIRDAAAGHRGVNKSLRKLRKTFLTAVEGRRSEKQARDEWARILIRGVSKVVAEGDEEADDPCEMISDRWAPRVVVMGQEGETSGTGHEGLSGAGSGTDARRGSGAFDYERDDIGNGQRMVAAYGADMRYVPGLGGWVTWTGNRWEPDRKGKVLRWAMELVRNMDQEAQFIEDLKQRAAFLKFIRASGSAGKLRAMIDLAAGMRNMTCAAEEFDADPRRLLTPNGVIELRDWDPTAPTIGGDGGKLEIPDPIAFRAPTREDKLISITRAEYLPDAKSDDWEKFLGRAVPNEETRHWMQKAFGYSLYGRNPGRHLFLIQGKTSSGKSTVVEAIAHALGEFASTFDLSLFRGAREVGANPMMVKVLSRRFIHVSETSSEWALHADQIKRVTGGSDKISARLLYTSDFVERVPAFTPWIVCNEAPIIRGADLALYRRIYTIPFNQSIPVDEEDVRLFDKLTTPEASAAILAWVVEGWRAYAKEGLRDAPTEVVGATLETVEGMSEFDDFLRDCCDKGAENAVASRDLYQAYKDWCEDNGVRGKDVETSTSFGRLLSKRGMEATRKRIPEKNTRVTIRAGVTLNRAWGTRVGALDVSGWREWWTG